MCALRKTGLEANIVSGSRSLENVDAVVLPGVGNFKAGSRNIQAMKSEIAELVGRGVPLLGVCLGMQLLFESSEESQGEGLGILKGKVVKLLLSTKIPHMGWNTLKVIRLNDLLDGISDNDFFYFVHSYYSNPVDKNVVVAETDYGLSFASVVACGNVWGTQFHPEKSGKPGEVVLYNFAEIIKK
jgi:glutamine amidotransferase